MAVSSSRGIVKTEIAALVKPMSQLILSWLFAGVLIPAGCSTQKGISLSEQGPSSANVSAPYRNSATPVSVGPRDGSIRADPNPIQVCDGSGLGVTTLTYTFLPPVEVVEVRVGSPAGVQMGQSKSGDIVKTGKWVSDGMIFYLQDVSNGKSLTPDNTLATVTINITTARCS